MIFTIQLTASYKSVELGIIKQINVKVDDVKKAYEFQKITLDSFLKNEKTELGFTGAFIGYTLKIFEGEIEFTKSRREIENELKV